MLTKLTIACCQPIVCVPNRMNQLGHSQQTTLIFDFSSVGKQDYRKPEQARGVNAAGLENGGCKRDEKEWSSLWGETATTTGRFREPRVRRPFVTRYQNHLTQLPARCGKP